MILRKDLLPRKEEALKRRGGRIRIVEGALLLAYAYVRASKSRGMCVLCEAECTHIHTCHNISMSLSGIKEEEFRPQLTAATNTMQNLEYCDLELQFSQRWTPGLKY